MNSLKGRISNGCADFMKEVRIAMANGQAPAPRSRHAPPASSAPAAQAPAPVHGGGQPPQPPAQGGGGSGGGFQGWAKENQIIVLAVVLLLLVVGYIPFNRVLLDMSVESFQKVNALNQPAPQAPPPPVAQLPATQAKVVPQIERSVPAPTAETPVRRIELADGVNHIIPENAKIVLRGPVTKMMIVNTASRIKSFSGEFKLVLEADGTRAWTPGFNSKPTPNDMTDFISRLPRWPTQNRVWIFVPAGQVLELNT